MITKPVNEAQEEFNHLCTLGGGPKGGPARTKLQQLLAKHGQRLNSYAHEEIEDQLGRLPQHNPWHICFAVGMCWGEMARLTDCFVEAAACCIADYNDGDANTASKYHTHKGVEAVKRSLMGASRLFEDVRNFPDGLPASLDVAVRAQSRWLHSVNKLQPAFIGPWNSSALFMVAVAADRQLTKQMKTVGPILPTGGPITTALNLLFSLGATTSPAQTLPEDEGISGLAAAAADNGTMQELIRGNSELTMFDVHSGLYMIGTRDARSRNYFHP